MLRILGCSVMIQVHMVHVYLQQETSMAPYYMYAIPRESTENALTGYNLSYKMIALGPDSGNGCTACESSKCC